VSPATICEGNEIPPNCGFYASYLIMNCSEELMIFAPTFSDDCEGFLTIAYAFQILFRDKN